MTEEPTGLGALTEEMIAELRKIDRHLRNVEERLDRLEASGRAGHRRASR